ncbi:hypothetical protein [Halobacillus mangrovi]|uniref:hypothetical protein n=1 Tax=Halobacillus mangrovi TaxID=402384 RepID=UPI003D982C68
MIRFPWACAEPPQTLSSGVSPVMFIPQESHHFPDLLTIIWNNGNAFEVKIINIITFIFI